MVGENIRYFRKMKGYTQRKLADKVGVSAAFISLLEQGNSGASDETMQKIANALDVTVYQLESITANRFALELCKVLILLTKQEKITWKIIEKTDVGDLFYACPFDVTAGFYCNKAINETVVVLKIEKENENIGKMQYGYCLGKTLALQDFKNGMDSVSFPVDELLTVYKTASYSPEEIDTISYLYETVQNSIDTSPVYSILQDFKAMLNSDDSEQDKE